MNPPLNGAVEDDGTDVKRPPPCLKETELRLGLPGCESPERCHEKPFFPLHPTASVHNMPCPKHALSRNKRGFFDAMDEAKHDAAVSVPDNRGVQKCSGKEAVVTKAQVVGWPPIRSFRKNTLASSKNGEEGEKGTKFVKVSMDGAPYLRKIDLGSYSAYQELSSALEKMFSCFTLVIQGQNGNKLKDLLHGSEYVLTFEDKDDDWMLVGDVPWEMFMETCKRLRIMKSSDAIGLAPRRLEKGKGGRS